MYKCSICGKEIETEYYDGGYIDHILNFIGNKEPIVKQGVDSCVENIMTNFKRVRKSEDIVDRLKCFCKWDNVNDELKKEVIKRVEGSLPLIKQAENRAKEIVDNLSALERNYLKGAML